MTSTTAISTPHACASPCSSSPELGKFTSRPGSRVAPGSRPATRCLPMWSGGRLHRQPEGTAVKSAGPAPQQAMGALTYALAPGFKSTSLAPRQSPPGLVWTYSRGSALPEASIKEMPGYPNRWQPTDVFVTARKSVCCPVGSLIRCPRSSLRSEAEQRAGTPVWPDQKLMLAVRRRRSPPRAPLPSLLLTWRANSARRITDQEDPSAGETRALGESEYESFARASEARRSPGRCSSPDSLLPPAATACTRRPPAQARIP
jgi:hypothetical protein